MYCKKCAKEFSYKLFECPYCGTPYELGVILHIRSFSNSRYEKLMVCGKEMEITLFDGVFENMFSDHIEVKALGLVVGHYVITPKSNLLCSRGFAANDFKNKRCIMGITFSEGLQISEEDSVWTEQAMVAFAHRDRDAEST